MLTIKIESEMTEGGCNACVPFKTEIATLVDNDITTHVGELAISSIVMAVALKAHFKQQLICDIDEDYILFKKENFEVTEHEQYGALTYKNSSGEHYQTRDYYTDKNDLFLHVNNILTTIFKLDGVAWTS